MPRRVACLLLLHLMHIACDGVVGSPRVRDACGVCGGSNATCQIISGIFTEPYLEAGYRLVAQIPAGACSIHIQEMGITDNYLALRDIHSRFILNGDWNIDNSGTYKGAGASFGYQRQTERTGERISALGPIAEPVDIVILYRQANRGIKYEYAIKRNNSLSSVLPRLPSATGVAQVPRPTLADQQRQPAPSAVAPPPPPPRARGGAGFVSSLYQPAQRPVRPGRTRPRPGGPSAAGAGARAGARRRRRRRRNRFQWVVTGFSACSRSCGGGTQIAEVVCMRRKRKQLARNRKCDPRRRPKPKATPCNTFPCPVSSWEPNPWSACSSTCGTGHQTRTFLCVRAGQPVEVTECEGRPTEPEVQECDAGPCPANARWQIGQWSPCSVSCDWGSRTRRVSCAEPGRCPATERPRDTAPCRLQPCPQQVHSDHRPAGWMTTDWTDQCSVECGQGVQWRGVTCGGDVGRCQPGSRPQQTRPCKTDRGCGGIWFTGPWSQCSHECGDGGQATRTVLCIRRTDAEFAVAAERACAATARPPDRQPCGGGAGCPPRWFVTEWAACSATCGIGRQRRTVACVDADGRRAGGCPPADAPAHSRACQLADCPEMAATTGQPVTEGSLPTGQTGAAGSAPTADAASPDGTPPPTVVDESVEQRPSILTLDESTLGGWRGTTNANKSVEQRPSVLTLDEATVGGWRGSTNTWITVDAPTPTEAGPVGSTEPTGVGATELGSSSEPTAAAVSRELELGSGGLDPINTATSAAATEALAGGAEPTRLPSETLPAGELERETPATNQPEEQLPTNELESELLETNELDGEPRFTFELDEKPPSANGLRGAPFPGQAPAENTLVTDGSAATTEGLANPRKHRKHKDRGGRREGRKEGSGSGASANNTDSCTDKFSYCSLVQQARLCKYKYYKNSCCAACRGAR